MDVDEAEARNEYTPDTSTLDTGRDADRFRHLLEHIQDAVVEFELVDGEPVVRGFNTAFLETFGYDVEAVLGSSLNEFIVPPWLREEAAELDDRTDADKVNYRLVRRQTAEGLREFLYRGVPGDGAHGFAVYTDLTEARRRERRLEVLNRLLRHNLRNQLNIVGGYAELLREEEDENRDARAERTAGVADIADADETPTLDRPSTVDRLVDAVGNLDGLVREAGEIHRTMNEPVPRDPSVDCVPMLERTAERFRRAYPHAEITTRAPPSLPVAATGRLEPAVTQLVENAVVHNPADRPRVWLEARRVSRGDWVDIVVADDGPEIPPMEHQTVTGEAPITPTNHGAGLGLWLVKWTVERFGGALSFDRSDAGGNRVRLRLRRGEETS